MDNDLLNITGSMGFAEEIGGRISFKPIAEFYQSTLNMAQSQVQAGLLDYNTAVRRAVDKMAKSGLRYVTLQTMPGGRIVPLPMCPSGCPMGR